MAAPRHPYPPGHVPYRAHSRHRLIALVGADPSPPAHSPPGRRPPGLLLGPLRWSRGGCYSSPAVSLSPCFVQYRSQNLKSHNTIPLKRPSGPRPADTEHTPTDTPRFPSAQKSPGRPFPSFTVFPLVARTPSTRRRITWAARVRKPSAENRLHIQKLPRIESTLVRVFVFSISLFRFHGAHNFGTLRLNLPD